MAFLLNEIRPVRGILYNPEIAGSGERLLAPPYDVISTKEREELAASSPFNAVHLILPGSDYEGAAQKLLTWRASGVLRRDERPAIYRYQQVFDSEGQTWTRTGFICGVRLRRFDERAVLPHERTLSAPKLDRLRLWRACRAYASQIFGLYSDPSDETGLQTEAPPDFEAPAFGVQHRLWRVTDPAVHQRLRDAMANRAIYIADGHHRYETMLALRDELGGGPRATTQFGSFFLCRMEDPGLRVLATHRVLFGLASFSLENFLARAGRYFEIAPARREGLREELARRGVYTPTLALSAGAEKKIFFLSLRPDADLSHLPVAPVLQRLDVTLLHSLLLEEILGVDREAQARQTNLRYLKDLDAALDSEGQAAFLLNPTSLDQLRAAAGAGEVLPQKSTYFFPKLASGLVIVPVDPAEDQP